MEGSIILRYRLLLKLAEEDVNVNSHALTLDRREKIKELEVQGSSGQSSYVVPAKDNQTSSQTEARSRFTGTNSPLSPCVLFRENGSKLQTWSCVSCRLSVVLRPN